MRSDSVRHGCFWLRRCGEGRVRTGNVGDCIRMTPRRRMIAMVASVFDCRTEHHGEHARTGGGGQVLCTSSWGHRIDCVRRRECRNGRRQGTRRVRQGLPLPGRNMAGQEAGGAMHASRRESIIMIVSRSASSRRATVEASRAHYVAGVVGGQGGRLER